ncbi:ABC transporter permease [Nakamurella lactea]|uniref:ABC transporter permease n=1 Tax=Nakamurella lactea TaxID=459515 RepID=UPI001B7FD8A0|nr:ABC transporter permease [Nakamurella lactea]
MINTGLAIGVPLVLLALWEVSSRTGLIDHRTFPAPTTALGEMVNLARDGELQRHVWATLRRILIGYPIGAAVGLFVGVVMGTSPRIRAALEPTLNGLYVVPKITLLPVFLSILGFGEPPMIALIAVTVFFFVWIGTMEAVVSIPGGFGESAQSLGLGRVATLRHVTIPAALPNLFVSLRVGMTIAILVIVAAEFVVGDSGLGYLIFHSRALFIYGWMYAGILLVALMGVILAAVVTGLGRWATPWMAADRARLRGLGG